MDAIYDRNILDVQTAKEYRDKILNGGFNSLTDTEKATYLNGLKGCLNYSDLNRIESNCDEIANLIGIYITTVTSWDTYDFPKAQDYERIKDNVQTLRNSGYYYKDTPIVPNLPFNRYDKINDIERILHDVYLVYTQNTNDLAYMGELYDTTYELYNDEEIGVI